MMMRGKELGLSVILAFVAATTGCSEEEDAVEALLPAVSVSEVVVIDLDEEIHASGDLEARFHTMIAAEGFDPRLIWDAIEDRDE